MVVLTLTVQWYQEQSAVWYSMHDNRFATSFAAILTQYPHLCLLLNYAVVVFELIGEPLSCTHYGYAYQCF